MSTTTAAAGGARDHGVIALVAIAHGVSHVMQMTIPPLFLVLRGEFAVSYTELGLIITLLYGASGLAQTPAGLLVDRHGAHPILVGGLALLSASVALMGLVTEFWMMLPLAVLAGIGNSVFHPADLTILSHKVEEKRLGRAYAAHTISGFVGYAAVPAIATALAAFGGWRVAVLVIGIGGLVLTTILQLCRAQLTYEKGLPRKGAEKKKSSALAALATPVILTAFAYFALTACAGVGVQAFAITAMTTGYGVDLPLATATLTTYFVGSTCGVLAGGWVAEHARNHERVAMGGVAVAVVLWLMMSAFAAYPLYVFPAVFLAGVFYGATGPSRDVLVRKASAGAGVGGTFGFVYSGFDLGSLIAPLIFGMLLDHGAPSFVFVGIAVLFALAIPTIMEVRRRILPAQAASATAD